MVFMVMTLIGKLSFMMIKFCAHRVCLHLFTDYSRIFISINTVKSSTSSAKRFKKGFLIQLRVKLFLAVFPAATPEL